MLPPFRHNRAGVRVQTFDFLPNHVGSSARNCIYAVIPSAWPSNIHRLNVLKNVTKWQYYVMTKPEDSATLCSLPGNCRELSTPPTRFPGVM